MSPTRWPLRANSKRAGGTARAASLRMPVGVGVVDENAVLGVGKGGRLASGLTLFVVVYTIS